MVKLCSFKFQNPYDLENVISVLENFKTFLRKFFMTIKYVEQLTSHWKLLISISPPESELNFLKKRSFFVFNMTK